LDRVTRSLQARLSLGVLALVALLWLVTAAWVWIDTRHELDELLDAHLAQAASMVVAQQAADIDDDMFERAPGLHRYAPRVALQIWHEGLLAMRTEEAPTSPLMPLDRHHEGFADVTADGVQWRVFASVGEAPPTQVFVAERVSAREEIMFAVMRSTLLPLVLALPFFAVAVWWVVRGGLSPLRALSTAVSIRQPEDLHPVALQQVPAEMDPLLHALNRLFERINALIESERRFTGDAAHELRTPIAAIRMQAQVALQSADDAERRHALESTLRGCDRATHMVTQLLTLSRLESSVADLQRDADLAVVTRDTMAELAPQAMRRGQELDCEAPPHRPVPADPALVGVLVRNLVDNAMRYSPRGSRVRVTVAGTPMASGTVLEGPGGEALLAVEDSGRGLDEAAMQRLGERFYRVLEASAGGTDGDDEADGSGLGLSIVRRIAEVYGWRIAFDHSPELGGLRVRMFER
jgi:two-component system sensor histidine kinase QseC